MGDRFVSDCNHEIYTRQFFRLFFLPYLQGHGLLRSSNFATMAT